MDSRVKIIKVEDVTGIDPATLAPRPFTKTTYMVGDHGPFFFTTPSKDYTAEYVSAETQKRVDVLRATGVIT